MVFPSEARDTGRPQPPELVAQGDFQSCSGEAGAHLLMSLANPATALIAADSLMGVGALVALKARGLRVGRDVYVIAFDELPYAGLFDPDSPSSTRTPRRWASCGGGPDGRSSAGSAPHARYCRPGLSCGSCRALAQARKLLSKAPNGFRAHQHLTPEGRTTDE